MIWHFNVLLRWNWWYCNYVHVINWIAACTWLQHNLIHGQLLCLVSCIKINKNTKIFLKFSFSSLIHHKWWMSHSFSSWTNSCLVTLLISQTIFSTIPKWQWISTKDSWNKAKRIICTFVHIFVKFKSFALLIYTGWFFWLVRPKKWLSARLHVNPFKKVLSVRIS